MIKKLLVGTLAAVLVATMTGQTALAAPTPAWSASTSDAAAPAVDAAAPAAAPAAAAPAVSAMPANPTDESKVPHYFGPYPNWANSPQVLANAVVSISLGTPTPVSFGNPLTERAIATDYAAPPGELAKLMVVLANAKLPKGTMQNFQLWNQVNPGGGPSPSAGNLLHAYVLRPTGVTNQYTVVYDSGQLTVPTVTTGEVSTFPAPNVPVEQDDVIGFYGEGVPLDTGVVVNPDILSYPATADTSLPNPVPPVQGATMTLGVDPGFPIYSQDRSYSFAATVTPMITDPGTGAEATATVDPKTGGISAVTVTNPGAGYVVPPAVAIDTAGVPPTTTAIASAHVSSGVLTSIAVNETGFGFTAPAVTVAGDGPTTGATATASGGVDNVTVNPGGGGQYEVQPVVKFGLPDLPDGVQATGTATMVPLDASAVPPTFTITEVAVVNPGSGYTSAPSVTIYDGTPTHVAPVPAATTATIGIAQIDLDNPGAGYTSAPTVTINDTVGVADKGASATASVAVLGAVTGITVTDPGAGYLTPGLKKFVDTLPGLTPDAKNNLDQYIPVAVADKTTYPGTDYYEIAVVQYRHKFASSLNPSLLRGYVQLDTGVIPGDGVDLTNANLDPAVAATPIVGYKGVDNPHYLGPTIVAEKDRPVRVLFRNLLPTGVGGDLFLPVDTSLMGSGAGPGMMTLDDNDVPEDMAADEGSVMDGVRNPMCADTPKMDTCYSENRATLHMHGGITPWISDGTPHQWITPTGENTAYPKGVSVSNVPDMPDPGPGAQTFFYTNQQSARLMWTHDHSWGITRLNVYAGEASAYLLTDPTEQSLIGTGGALEGLGLGEPLVVQDKTFVPDAATMAKADPTWNYAKWGGEGNLWTPHVYMPAQNPGDPSGMSAFGRWMYGPWFWPPATDVKYPPMANPYYDPACDPNVQPFCEPAQIPSTPNVSVGMEAFNDTPLVNGTAYPTTTVDPKAYRYRVLNAANDRFWNLSWYVADPSTGTLSEVALNPTELAAAQTDPNVVPTPDTTKSPAGPNWIQIGTEGGFLPAPVVVPAHPTTWITDPTRFDVGNVDEHSLLLAPAERADVVVDFSQYRGKTLILYNDAPAAFPARVPGYDYYTGGPDLSPSGAPTTLAGYGPNTRTVMQVKVSTAAPETAFDRPNTTTDRMGALEATFAHHADGSGVFESASDPVIVGQAAYNSAYGTSFAASGWCNSPDNPTPYCDGFARIAEQGGFPFKFDTLSGNQISVKVEPKGMHDEMNSASFDEWGRMTANLGLEAPGATPLLQNIILYPFSNPATEVLDATGMPSSLDVTPISTGADGTQIWKITHNGVDTHPIHWHLYNVQLINRVTWDGIIIPPEPTELGWKDTVRVSPLEDTIVAIRPIVPTLPFGVPDSLRPLNPMMPIGAKGDPNALNGVQAGFNNTDANGNPIAPIVNNIANFGWEYVFHCHILSHEEMDMMRPVTVHVARAAPAAPALSFTRGSVILTWTDGTPVDYANPASWTNPGTAEIGYRIERAQVTGGVTGAYTEIATAPANATTFTDDTLTRDPTLTYDYRVTAWNVAGSATSDPIRVLGVDLAPTGLTAVVQPAPTLPAGSQVALNWTNLATTATSVVVERAVGSGTFSLLSTLAADATSYIDTTVSPGPYSYRLRAINPVGPSDPSGPATVIVPQPGSTTVVLNSPNPSVVGENVTFTATVSPALATGTPTGTVTFTADGATTSVPLSAGVATLATAALPAGTHTITADYSGDAVFTPSTGSVIQTVNKIATTTVVVSGINPSSVGQEVTFTATVSPVLGTGTPTGTVTFTADGATTSVPLSAGVATLATAALPAGTHTITADYSGDAAFTPSTGSVIQTVNKIATTTVVVSGINPSSVGQPVTFTATVSPVLGTGTPTGTVTFTADGTTTSVPLSAGVATLATAALLEGTHTITADYSGDAAFTPSTGSVTQTVDKTAPGAVVSVTQARIADSRAGLQIPAAVPAFGTTPVQVTGEGGVPLSGVSAVLLNVSAVSPQTGGYITVWPSGIDRPGTSNLNFQAGQDIPNTVIVPVGSDGKIQLFNGSSGTVHLVVDVTGYTVTGTPTAAGAVVSVTPARIADSRAGLQIPAAVPAFGTSPVQVTGEGGVPLSGVSAVLLNVTVSPQTGGYITVWPSGIDRPGTSNLNFRAGQDIANTVIVPVGADGKIQLFNGSSGTVHLVVDVAGYTVTGTPTAPGAVVSVTPARIADSRAGLQIPAAVPAFGTTPVQVTGEGGVPVSGVSAVLLNVTAVSPQTGGYITVWPSGIDRPGTSNLNFQAGQDIPNTVIVPVGADGKIQLFNGSSGTVHLVVDVTGYTLAGPAAPAPAAG